MMTDMQKIARGWVNYAGANELKPNTKKYLERQHAYVMGVACMLAPLPPAVVIYMMSGRDIAELAREPAAA
jgi:hypothetical protein